MPNRNQNQDSGQQNKGMQNPGTFSPDDDEAQEADQTRVGDQSQDLRRRKGQQDAQPDTGIEDADLDSDEDVGDDDDEDDEDVSPLP
jgi:hypothetical protein